MTSTDPRRGEIWLAALGAARKGEPGKNRPALVMSVDEISTGVETDLFVVVPISSARTPSRLRPRISPGEGIEEESVAVCRGVRGLARTRLLRRVGLVGPSTLRQIERSLGMILGVGEHG